MLTYIQSRFNQQYQQKYNQFQILKFKTIMFAIVISISILNYIIFNNVANNSNSKFEQNFKLNIN